MATASHVPVDGRRLNKAPGKDSKPVNEACNNYRESFPGKSSGNMREERHSAAANCEDSAPASVLPYRATQQVGNDRPLSREHRSIFE